ncbi:MAG: hypothetical protein KZQ95_21405 [Candidatus Thiodiazotropha sp. (ex Epidulcina cf. delphinae)]|nr:hypothetical protein [Candidatus Thiodiazotropha sp. (ex Epidulcina cf. delphinae)]
MSKIMTISNNTPILEMAPTNGSARQQLKYSIFFMLLLLVGQPAYPATEYHYAPSGSNCGPAEWQNFQDASFGCQSTYTSRYPFTSEPPCSFPADQGVRGRISDLKDGNITTGSKFQYILVTHCDGRYAGGAYFKANICLAGAIWDGLRMTCVIGVEKKGGCPTNAEGNPCDASTGNKFQRETDFDADTLRFVRYYNSSYDEHYGNYYHRDIPSNEILETDKTQPLNTETSSLIAPVLGYKWSHNYSAYLVVDETHERAVIHRADGAERLMRYSNGNWEPEPDSTDSLIAQTDGWILKTDSDTLETYNTIGQLISIQKRNGQLTLLSYNADGRLETVTGPFGKTIAFAYDDEDRLDALTMPDNTVTRYQYDPTSGNLASVIYPDATPGNESDNPRKTYHYEDAGFPRHLTGISDENGNRYATWSYDVSGKAKSSEHANGAEGIALAYHADGSTTVTDALGRVKTYTFETHFDVHKPKTITLQYFDGTQSVTKTEYFSYYVENGWLKENTDYNGNTTYYEYNDRGLVILETKAKGTPEAYTIVTEWHPQFHLPVKITGPGKITEFTYDAMGRQLSRREYGRQ